MMPEEKASLVKYRLTRANEALREATLLYDNKLWNSAVNRLYYAGFYAVTALLVSHGYTTRTHSGARQLFQLHFIKTGIIRQQLGRFYSEVFDKRQRGDYEDFTDFTEADVTELVPMAGELVAVIGSLLHP